jgi:4-hydroxyphenylpyruvate dioxygenase-like putative hemolysin
VCNGSNEEFNNF